MSHHQPFEVAGFHSCDREIGLEVLNGKDDLRASDNKWDWLANGIYFWEQNPGRPLEYAKENAKGNQFNKVRIKTPFVIGAQIELGNCLNLMEPKSLSIVQEAYKGLEKLYDKTGIRIPMNKGNNRALDCAVIKYVHQSRKEENMPAYDSIRCAFIEGEPLYSGSNFTTRLHIQICLLNPSLIKGYFLPRPIEIFNPYLST